MEKIREFFGKLFARDSRGRVHTVDSTDVTLVCKDGHQVRTEAGLLVPDKNSDVSSDFDSEENIESAKGQARDERSLDCLLCGTTVVGKDKLKIHIGAVHMEEQLLTKLVITFPAGGAFSAICVECGEKCSSDYEKKEHILLSHPWSFLRAEVEESIVKFGTEIENSEGEAGESGEGGEGGEGGEDEEDVFVFEGEEEEEDQAVDQAVRSAQRAIVEEEVVALVELGLEGEGGEDVFVFEGEELELEQSQKDTEDSETIQFDFDTYAIQH